MVLPVIQDMNTIEDLGVSGFGCSRPRHGLQLLFWFAKNCVHFDNHNNMRVQCDPRGGDFGFHHFGNFEDILPVLMHGGRENYFEVGNLNTEMYPEADNLPPFVKERYNLYNLQSNRDRVIICLDQSYVTAIYVSEHTEGDIRGMFDREHTYRVSPDLIQIIQRPELDLETFLDHVRLSQNERPTHMGLMQRERPDDFGVCILVVGLVIICFVLSLVAGKLSR